MHRPKGAALPALTGLPLYIRFAFAGAVCCGVTHAAVTPVDVVKTRLQLDPARYHGGLLAAGRKIVGEEGALALLTGLGPTIAGYCLQGSLKFGGYEFWKKTFVDMLGHESALRHRDAVYLGAGGIAEFFADIALCPLEATRIRMVKDPTFAPNFPSAFGRLFREEGAMKGFYSGFGPLLFKQVPYTMFKFLTFERLSDLIKSSLLPRLLPPSDALNPTPSITTAVNLTSGLGAGIVAAVVSQPADTLLSRVNKEPARPGEETGSRLLRLAREAGPRGLFTGLGARL